MQQLSQNLTNVGKDEVRALVDSKLKQNSCKNITFFRNNVGDILRVQGRYKFGFETYTCYLWVGGWLCISFCLTKMRLQHWEEVLRLLVWETAKEIFRWVIGWDGRFTLLWIFLVRMMVWGIVVDLVAIVHGVIENISTATNWFVHLFWISRGFYWVFGQKCSCL